METETRKQQMQDSEEKSFNEYMAKAETKLFISLIPPIENPDVLQTLLRSAFGAGVAAGTGIVLTSLFDSMTKDRKYP